MKKLRSLASASIAAAISLSLAGCNPPMPPEVLAAMAEASYTCVSTTISANFSPEFSDVAEELVSSVNLNCPEMHVSTATEPAPIQIGFEVSNASSAPYAEVPYAVDAGVFAITSSLGASAVLTPESIEGILNGSITQWDDPQIVADNFGAAPLEGPLSLAVQTSGPALKALQVWFQHYTSRDLPNTLVAQASVTVDDYQNLPEGSIAFMPGSVLNELSMVSMAPPMPASLATDKVSAPEGATPDFTSIQVGASQWSVSKTKESVTVSLDFAKKPIPPLGFDEAPAPYQIVFPLMMRLYGTDNLGARATARYLLRQDSQGSLTLVAGLPVSVRAESLAFVSKGLPEPVMTDAPVN
jgi:hypothetical protein